MSPAAKSKGKDKSSARAVKEQHKAAAAAAAAATAVKPSSATGGSAGSGITASAYNPLSGTFHTLETAPTASSPPPHINGRFRNIDETDDHSGSSLGAEYDSVSNNDSCSGESEDLKEKASNNTTRQEAIPGSDNDKREKIRQKNERKHQRQREKRAQELHERCSGYLMSRKLEALAQQLVVMGFSSERATMALILNEGRIEESVAWLFEGSSEDDNTSSVQKIDSGSNLKIDITQELNQMTEMEVKFKSSKQEVERAVVTCEGDLDKAKEILRAQKQEVSTCPPKPGETGDPVKVTTVPTPGRAIQPVQPVKTNGKDFNYTKPVAVPVAQQALNLRRTQIRPPPQVAAVAQPVEKRWPNGTPLVSSAAPPTKAEPPLRYVDKSSPPPPSPSPPPPVIMMQRPNSINVKQTNWYPSEMLKPNTTTVSIAPPPPPPPPPTVSPPPQFYPPASSLTLPPSLGLFSGWGSGSSSPVDWNTGGSMPQCDYTSIDWTLGSTTGGSTTTAAAPVGSRSNGLWLGLADFVKNNRMKKEEVTSSGEATSEGPHEWTSPFAGTDLFSVPRQVATSPSL